MENFTQQLTESILGYYQLFVNWLPRIALAVVVYLVLWYISRQLTKLAGKQFTERVDDQLLARFLTRLLRTFLAVLVFATILQVLGLGNIAAGLLTGAGIGAFVIGFAFKDIGENLLAGIMLAFHRPFSIGHVIEVDGVTGSVVALNLRNTQVKTFDGKDVFIPNSIMLKQKVTNFVIDGFLRQDFKLRLDFNDDVEKAREIVLTTLASIPGVLQETKPPSVHLMDMDTSSKQLTAFYWIDTFDSKVSGLEVKTQAIAQSLIALNKAGFYRPGDIIELKSYQDESPALAKA
ncbi:MAG: mechanosensitive ion channel family protein [Bacteroidota bacterium]